MQTSSTGTSGGSASRHSGGFTLIELMVVLAILVVMSAVAVIAMQPALSEAKMRSGCRTVVSMLNYARNHAAAANTTVRVVFGDDRSIELDVPASDQTGDTQSGSVQSGDEQFRQLTTAAGRRRYLPEGVEITGISKPDGVDNENWLEFTRLGQSEETLIEITDDRGQKRYVVVDPITGRCRIRTYEEEQQHKTETPAQAAK